MSPSIQGLRDTQDIIAAFHDRPENFRHGILMREPNGQAPLFALTAAAQSESTDDPNYHWFEEEMPDYRLALNADIDAVETDITVVDGALQFKVNDVIYVEQTAELMIVDANPTVDTTISVVRGFAGSTATLVDHDGAGINPNLFLLGAADPEGSAVPEGRSFNPSEIFNYTQIFRNAFSITKTAENTRYRTGDPVKNDKRRALNRHSQMIERTLFFGRRSLDSSGATPKRTTGGIIQQIDSELTFTPTSSGTVGYAEFLGWMKDVFYWGSSEKMMFCGNNVMLGLNEMARKNSQFEMDNVDRSDFFGMNVHRFMTPFGTLIVKTHPMFNQMTSGTTTAVDYNAIDTWGVIIDMANIKYRYMKNDDTMFEDNLQVKGTRARIGAYSTQCGLQTIHAKTHALVTGVIGGVAD